MFAMGAAAASTVSWLEYVVGQAMVTSAQLAAHYVNEYADVEADRGVTNRTWFSGGSGVLVDAALPSSVALTSAIVVSAIAITCGVGLMVIGRPLTALIGGVALIISWIYSMPPIRMLGTGWGEMATSIVVVVLVPLMGVTAQGSDIPSSLIWASAVLLPVHLAMMLIFEIPDLKSDAAAGKQVVAVRIGRQGTHRLVLLMLIVAGGVLAYALQMSSLPDGSSWAWVGVIPALVMVFASRRDRHGVATAAAVITLAVVGTGLAIAFI